MPSITSPARRATCRPSWAVRRCWVSIPSYCDPGSPCTKCVKYPVIPGRRAAASPEPIHTGLWDMLGWTAPDGIDSATCDYAIQQGSRPMTIIRIGLDTAKHVFQVHGVDENEQPVLRRRLGRREVEK